MSLEQQPTEQEFLEQHSSAELCRDLEALSSRDWQLWSICALVIVIVAIGFAAFVVPNLVWTNVVMRTDARYIPQLFFGLITLIILFNVYILEQNGGAISCYDAKTGKPAYQKERIDGAGSFWASPWAYDGKIFCLDDAGKTHVLKAGPKLELLGTNSIRDQFWASPAIAGGTLILRGVSSIYAIKQ